MQKLTPIVIAGIFSATSLSVMAQEVEFDEQDKDRNGVLSESEWQDVQGVSADFDEIDSNRDGELTEMEVRRVTMSSQSAGGASAQGGMYDLRVDAETETSGTSASSSQSTSGMSGSAGMQSTSGQSASSSRHGKSKDKITVSFDELDKNGDGNISLEEARQSEALSIEFASLDSDYNQQLDRNEFDKAKMKQRASTSGQSGASMQSTSGSGSQQGGNATFQQTGASGQSGSQQKSQQSGGEYPKMSKDAFQRIDQDGNERISRNEAQQSGDNYVTASFDGLDQNGDGEIAKEEVIKQ